VVVAGRGWVDVHPLLFDPAGNARQPAVHGGYFSFPRSYFRTGCLEGRQVGCFCVEAQRRFHSGYEPRQVDLHDLAQLDSVPSGSG
jgi:lincosamide nucleotidyltransferase A/C/D/E